MQKKIINFTWNKSVLGLLKYEYEGRLNFNYCGTGAKVLHK